MTEMTIDDEWLQASHYLGLQFADGWYFTRLTGREPANLRHNLKYDATHTAHTAGQTTADWDDIPVSATDDRKQLSPGTDHRREVYQIFYGISPTVARIFFDFVTRQDRWNLATVRAVPGNIGFINGEQSPYYDPSVKTEIFTINEVYPAFKAYNASTQSETIYMNFQVMKYTWDPVKDPELIKEFLTGKRRVKLYSMGLSTDQMITSPQWWAEYFRGVPKKLAELGVKI